MRITRPDEWEGAMVRLLDLVTAPLLPREGERALVCLDCYRDGGCREHSRPNDVEVNDQ